VWMAVWGKGTHARRRSCSRVSTTGAQSPIASSAKFVARLTHEEADLWWGGSNGLAIDRDWPPVRWGETDPFCPRTPGSSPRLSRAQGLKAPGPSFLITHRSRSSGPFWRRKSFVLAPQRPRRIAHRNVWVTTTRGVASRPTKPQEISGGEDRKGSVVVKFQPEAMADTTAPEERPGDEGKSPPRPPAGKFRTASSPTPPTGRTITCPRPYERPKIRTLSGASRCFDPPKRQVPLRIIGKTERAPGRVSPRPTEEPPHAKWCFDSRPSFRARPDPFARPAHHGSRSWTTAGGKNMRRRVNRECVSEPRASVGLAIRPRTTLLLTWPDVFRIVRHARGTWLASRHFGSVKPEGRQVRSSVPAATREPRLLNGAKWEKDRHPGHAAGKSGRRREATDRGGVVYGGKAPLVKGTLSCPADLWGSTLRPAVDFRKRAPSTELAATRGCFTPILLSGPAGRSPGCLDYECRDVSLSLRVL